METLVSIKDIGRLFTQISGNGEGNNMETEEAANTGGGGSACGQETATQGADVRMDGGTIWREQSAIR